MQSIKIKLPDGSIREFEKDITAFKIAEAISPRLSQDTLAVEVDGVVRDLSYKIENDSSVKFLTFDDEKGKEVYWHSTSHLMAHAIQEIYPEAKFGVGPAIEAGFYYDIDINSQLSEEDLKVVEKKMAQLTQEDSPFVREDLSKNAAIDFFKQKGDNYKIEILSEIDENSQGISIYKEGSFTDLCRGPHLPSAGKIKYFKLLNISGSYWRGDEKNKQMQRIYGISFPKKKMLDDYLIFLEEAKKRDHRKLGKQLDLYSIHEEAGAGLIYWHPKGARIRSEIENFWREAHLKNGYEVLYSPHMGKSWLWETSGHLDFYKESMYAEMRVDEQDYYIKPMNCPFHIMIYKSHLRSYRDLPLRWAELGTVYRYEKSGVLHGLLRVRGFTQDDAHIFCRLDQLEDEIISVLDFIHYIMQVFKFDYEVKLSTRPEKYAGTIENWDKATAILEKSLQDRNVPFEVDPGEGVFYGPKIDVKLKDALGRVWQGPTVQVDFNLPQRFDLIYTANDGSKQTPVMVHRAILGSIERFLGALIEHYAGAFPLWLAPVQVSLLPITDSHLDYADKIAQQLQQRGFRVEIDKRNEKIGAKIRNAQLQKIPYMLIVGDKELESETVSVRHRKEGDLGTKNIAEILDQLCQDVDNRA